MIGLYIWEAKNKVALAVDSMGDMAYNFVTYATQSQRDWPFCRALSVSSVTPSTF